MLARPTSRVNYDALVAAAAAEHGITLATRDRRAADTYRALDTAFELFT